jgi:hypothetical protein
VEEEGHADHGADPGRGARVRESDVPEDLLAGLLRRPGDPLSADRVDQLEEPVADRRIRDLLDQLCRPGVDAEVARLAPP